MKASELSQPIPLTKDWLSRCELTILNVYLMETNPANAIKRINDNPKIIDLRTKYLHQLQNLYYALHQEELTIK